MVEMRQFSSIISIIQYVVKRVNLNQFALDIAWPITYHTQPVLRKNVVTRVLRKLL